MRTTGATPGERSNIARPGWRKFALRGGCPPMHGSGVILLHGLVRSAAHMAPLARYLRNHTQHNVFNVTYPTTRGSIDEHAEQLARVIERLEGIDELWFVGHSLGNLVIRRYLASVSDAERSRVRRIVMLGSSQSGGPHGRGVRPPALVRSAAGQGGHATARFAAGATSAGRAGLSVRHHCRRTQPARAVTIRCWPATTTCWSTSPARGCQEPPISWSCRSFTRR